MNEFDDRELGDALRRRAGAASDGFGIEAARSAVVARAARLRRRRAAVAGGGVMAGLIVLAVLVVGPGSESVVTTPADSSDGSAPAPVDTPADVAADSTDPERTASDQDTVATTTPADNAPSPATTVPAVIPPTGTATSTSAPSPNAPSTTAPAAPETTVAAPPTSPQPTPPTTTVTTPPPGPGTSVDTYSSAGGSVTVRWDGAALDLQSVAPAAGFEAEVEDDRADRVRVRFRGDGGDVRIELRVENGEIVRVE